ncbi:MAG TPA: pilus assembly protein TadG-related protein [Frankiaceae bacterium]|nr:pilus assembly protein TadG-related protein [Frankiaceae bacterium]
MTRRPRGDDGAYAILYGLLLLAVLGMAALVVDLASLRQNRRETRLAADAAAIAGAGQLDTAAGTANPRQACVDAWSYLATNLGFTVPGTTGCGVLPETAAACPTNPPAPTVARGTVDEFTIAITWPVADDSALLTEPNVTTGDTVTQAIDPETDGEDPCGRIAVTVQQDQEPAFSSVFGQDGTATTVTSVARSTTTLGDEGPIAALNVLEDNECQAILTSGQASIEISAVDDRPGIIAVESSGRDPNDCPNNKPWVIDVAESAAGGHVWAHGVDGVGQGTIYSYALNSDANPGEAYNPDTIAPGSDLLLPTPEIMGERFGATPVTNIYDCAGTDDCPDSPEAYVTSLENAFDSNTPQPYAHSAVFSSTAFKTVSVANGILGWPNNCTVGTGATIYVPAGNWYLDCNTVTVRGRLIFAGGNVVSRGGIHVEGGCFAMNVPLLSATACPTQNALGEVVPSASTEGILFLRGGNFTKGSQGAIFVERSFVYMKTGHIAFGAGSGALYLTNPRPDTDSCDEECQNSRFGKLALWNESTQTQELGGQAAIVLRGILFVPNATFDYTGQAAQVQTNAQFWANKLEIGGQGTLVMAPDPNDSVARPESGTVLIR